MSITEEEVAERTEKLLVDHPPGETPPVPSSSGPSSTPAWHGSTSLRATAVSAGAPSCSGSSTRS